LKAERGTLRKYKENEILTEKEVRVENYSTLRLNDELDTIIKRRRKTLKVLEIGQRESGGGKWLMRKKGGGETELGTTNRNGRPSNISKERVGRNWSSSRKL